MSTSKERQLIFEYWFRIIIGSDISIQDISNITLKFGEKYEMFDSSLSHKSIEIQNDGQLLFLSASLCKKISGFGTVTAKSGYRYHWKLKLFGDNVQYINIGIIEADKCSANTSNSWWITEYGYSYWSGDGEIYHDWSQQGIFRNHKHYGKSYGKDDIIDIWLDLKDENQLSFAKNDETFGKAADLKQSVDFRLAVAIWFANCKIQILSFEMY